MTTAARQDSQRRPGADEKQTQPISHCEFPFDWQILWTQSCRVCSADDICTFAPSGQTRVATHQALNRSFSIKQHWHERHQQDPANRWLRSTVADLFLEA
ncbi:hypothetical protein VAPA_1c22150 [Variovorax paradoxus B4]|uniref:Uncharacterized protein n=1 Tax=Variovorax paradoxus B4 TaxID=1246301 RepID=T1XAG4_VARPD|nr:hypothetical protein VAPA_1c22150 [Variovorax paradoxus B4]